MMVNTVDAVWLSKRVAFSDQVLVLDARSLDEFNSGFISGAIHIFCTGVIQRRLKNGSLRIESLLNLEEDKQKYERAKISDNVCVVVCDADTQNVDRLSADSTAALLLKRIAGECKFAAFLAGGYSAFERVCSHHCVLPDSAKDGQLKKRPSSLVLQLSTLSLTTKSQAPPAPEEESPKDYAPFHILPHLYLGCRKIASNLHSLKEHRITRILNVTNSIPNQFQDLEGFKYKQIAVEDVHEVDMLKQLPEAFSFIEEAKRRGEKVLVHCHAGMSRSATVVIAYLMKYYGHTLDTAYEFVKNIKPNISPNVSFMGQLLEFECSLQPSPSDSGIGSSLPTPIDGHCFLSEIVPSPTDLSQSCILAA